MASSFLDTAKEKPQQGEVIAVGTGARDESGKVNALEVKVGDRVLFGKWSGTEVKIDGEDLLIMKESDILGVLEGEVRVQGRRLTFRADPGSTPPLTQGSLRWPRKMLNLVKTRARRCCAASISLPMRVKVTLGPKGRNVVLEKSFGAPRITKDGVTVAKEVELEDKFENMGAQMLKEVASKRLTLPGTAPPPRRCSPGDRQGRREVCCRRLLTRWI